MLISIAIPVYRNAASLEELYKRIVDTMLAIKDADYEIIFVDDGSDDGSADIIKQLCKKDAKIIGIKLSRNFGQHAANNAAFQHVKGDIVINMSADLQDPPELIKELVEKITDGNDVALATRTRVKETWLRRATSKLHYRIVRIAVPEYPRMGFDFWAVNKKAFKALMSFDDIVRRNQIDLLSIGYKVTHIPYAKQARKHGKSQYNFMKRLDVSLSQIFATAIWPLRLSSTAGVICFLAGIAYASVLIVNYFFHGTTYPGWTSIVVLMLLIGGINMLILGVMGEYMWRIYYETKRRPIYFIDEIYSAKKPTERKKFNT